MSTSKKYNIWFALCYELTHAIIEYYPKLKKYKIVKLILNYCKHDWILWRIETALESVDRDIERLHKQWDAEEKPKAIFIEHPPDGSDAQKLLGGAMEIKSTFKRN